MGTLSKEQIQEIGNIYHQNSARTTELVFDVTRHLGWRIGTYGDSGSCYAAGHEYEYARQAMMDVGIMALRTFNTGGHAKGRSWLYKPNNDMIILFNTYGPYTGQQLAPLIGEMLGTEPRFTILRSYGHYHYVEWDTAYHTYLNNDAQAIPLKPKVVIPSEMELPNMRLVRTATWVMSRKQPHKKKIGSLKK